MSVRHSVGEFVGTSALLIMGKVTGATGVLSNISGPNALAQDVTCVRTGTGAYTLTINPLKGPQGAVNINLDVQAADVSIRFVAHAYTDDSLQITVTTRTIVTPAAVDSDFFFQIFAW